MTIQTSRNARSIRNIARSTATALVLTVSLGGTARADLADSVSDIKRSVNAIKKKVNIIPDNAPVRNLFKKVDVAVVGKLMDAVGDTKDVLDTLEAKRAGFEEYKNGGDADRMRRDLKALFEDLRVLADTSQKLRCFRDPEARLAPMDVTFANKAIDQMPAIAVFGLQKVLDETAADWRTKLSDILAELPVDSISGMCEAGASVAGSVQGFSFDALRCQVAREIDETRMARIELAASSAAKVFEVIKEYAPEDVSFTLAVTVVGGGGAGTNVTLPIHGMLETIIKVMDKLETGAAKVQEIQGECSDADERMERDLLSCTALASYDAQIDDVRDLALRRLETLDASFADYDRIGTAQSFGQLCTSYRDFRLQ